MNDKSEKGAPARATGEPRKPYVPPQIKRIQLSVDEALMSICKAGLSGGPLGPGCFGEFQGACMGGGS